MDLGLQLDMDMSVEQGRHVSAGPGLGDFGPARAYSREPSIRGSRIGSVGPSGLGMDDTFGGIDLDLNLGDDSLELPRLEERSRRECGSSAIHIHHTDTA